MIFQVITQDVFLNLAHDVSGQAVLEYYFARHLEPGKITGSGTEVGVVGHFSNLERSLMAPLSAELAIRP